MNNMDNENIQPNKGGRIDRPGSSADYKTGEWRSGLIPKYIPKNCINCLFCVNYCPEQCWTAKDGKIEGVDLTYCKGCGLCAQVCLAKDKAIVMKKENE